MPTGVIKKIIREKGFGFISGQPKDYFFHRDACGGKFDELSEGQSVSFDVEENPRGPKAVNVVAVVASSRAA